MASGRDTRMIQISKGVWKLQRPKTPTMLEESQASGERGALEALGSRRLAKHASAVIASIQDGLMLLDEKGVVTDANARICSMTGLTRRELIGSRPPYPFWSVAHRDENKKIVASFLKDLLASGEASGEMELTYRRKNGTEFPVIVSVARLQGVEHDLAGYVGTVKDVSRRRRAEDEIKRSLATANALAAEQGAFRRVATAIASGGDSQSTIGAVAEEMARLLDVEAALVYRFDGGRATVVGAYGSPALGVGAGFALRGEGAVPRVARTGQPVRIDDHSAGPETDSETARRIHPDYRASVTAPIKLASGVWGAVMAATTRADAIEPEGEERLLRFADLVGIAIAGADARARLAASATRDLLTGLWNRREFEERLESEVARAHRHGAELSIVVFDIDDLRILNQDRGTPFGDGVIVDVAKHLTALIRTGDVLARLGGDTFGLLLPHCDDLGAWEVSERARAVIGAASQGRGERIRISAGVCDLAHAESRARDVLRLAEVALHWAKTHGKNTSLRYSPDVVQLRSPDDQLQLLRRSRAVASIRVLARAIDAKDPVTQRHSERVGEMAELLARESGWSAADASRLHEAALIHDVGKLGISDAVLLKTTPLTQDEREDIKRHVQLGVEMITGVLSDEQVDWVRAHHERFDGAGYPSGLLGTRIPEGARLLALADAWDAMTVARPHHLDTLTPREALAECRRESGHQFWPPAVAALTKIVRATATQPTRPQASRDGHRSNDRRGTEPTPPLGVAAPDTMPPGVVE